MEALFQWEANANMILSRRDTRITEVFFSLLRSMVNNQKQMRGECYSIAIVLWIVLHELELNAKLCFGWVAFRTGCVNHAWVEVDGEIYDIAICLQNHEMIIPPIFAGTCLGTTQKTDMLYGVDLPHDKALINPNEKIIRKLHSRVTNDCSFPKPDFSDGRFMQENAEPPSVIRRYPADSYVKGESETVLEVILLGMWATELSTLLVFLENNKCGLEQHGYHEFNWIYRNHRIFVLDKLEKNSPEAKVIFILTGPYAYPNEGRVILHSENFGEFYRLSS